MHSVFGDKVQKESAALVPLNQNTAGHQFGFGVMFLYLTELGKSLCEERGKERFLQAKAWRRKLLTHITGRRWKTTAGLR